MIAFGFWAGDDQLAAPTFYSYTSPEPEGLRDEPLAPSAAEWLQRGDGSLAVLPYDVVRASADPPGTLLAFLDSAYEAGVRAAAWPPAALEPTGSPA